MHDAKLSKRILLVGLIAMVGLACRFGVYCFLTGTGASAQGYIVAMCRYDCGWFNALAANGYDQTPSGANGQANWAFFPLLPVSMWLLNRLSGLPLVTCGFLVSQASVIIAAFVARPLFQEAQDRAYYLFCVFLLAGPFAFYFNASLSEGLFVLLSTACFSSIARQNYILAGLLAALLSATRVTGILMLIPLANAAWEQGKAGQLVGASRASVASAFIAAPLGLLAYMAHLYFLTGDPLAFVHIQSTWGREPGNPVVNLARGLLFMLKGINGFELAFVGVLALGLSAALFRAGRRGMGLFCAACILLSASSGLLSLPRFAAGLAPLLIAVAEPAAGKWWRFSAAAALAIGVGAFLTSQWLVGHPFYLA